MAFLAKSLVDSLITFLVDKLLKWPVFLKNKKFTDQFHEKYLLCLKEYQKVAENTFDEHIINEKFATDFFTSYLSKYSEEARTHFSGVENKDQVLFWHKETSRWKRKILQQAKKIRNDLH